MTASRPGIALVVALFAMVALGTIAAGLTFVALQESRIAQAGEESLRVRLAAESATRATLARWRTSRYADLAVGEMATESGGSDELVGAGAIGVEIEIEIEALRSPLYLVRARAVTPAGAVARSAALVRVLDPLALWRDLPAALTTRAPVQTRDDARIEGWTIAAAVPPDAVACGAEGATTLLHVFGDLDRPAILTPDLDRPDSIRLGPLGPGDLRAIADRVESGSIALHPVERDGDCDTSIVGNWGAPGRPAHRCADYFPLIFSPGDLEVTSGAGQGILVVAGDLTLSGDARFFGPALVGGRLHLRDRARILGAVSVAHATAPPLLDRESFLAYDPCALRAALLHSPAIDRPIAPATRVWLPDF